MKILQYARVTMRGALEDNITGEAAKAAYYFFLSLFPMILALFALTGILGGNEAFRYIMGWLTSVLPEDATVYLEEFVREITDQERPGALSIGLLLAIWAASNFFAAIGDGLDAMFNVRHRASWIRKRGKALLLMVIGVVLLGGGMTALLAGPYLADAVGLGVVAEFIVWPIAFLLIVALLWITYYIMPAHDQNDIRLELVGGAVVGAIVWLGATAGFRFYVANFSNYGRTYGFIGGIIVLLLWLYITALAILFGGEVADTLAGGNDGAGGNDSAGGK